MKNASFLWLKDLLRTLLLMALIALCVIGFILLKNQKTLLEQQYDLLMPKETGIITDSVKPGTIRLMRGQLDTFETSDGFIVSFGKNGLNRVETRIQKGNDLSLAVQEGELVDGGDLLFKYRGKSYLSPVGGRVVTIENEESYIAVTVLNYDSLRLSAQISPEAAEVLSIGSKISFSVGKNQYEGTVESIGWFVEDKKVPIRLSFTDVERAMRLGSSASFTIPVHSKQNVYYLPVSCVLKAEGENYIVQLCKENENGKYTYPIVPVKIGLRNQNAIEILDGLDINDEVLIQPDQQFGRSLAKED